MRLIQLQAELGFDLEEIETAATDPDCLSDADLGQGAREWVPLLVKALRAQDAALKALEVPPAEVSAVEESPHAPTLPEWSPGKKPSLTV